MTASLRLARLVVDRGLVRSRSQAHALIIAGGVRVDGEVVRRPAAVVPVAAVLSADADPYVRQGLVTSWRVREWNVVVGGTDGAR